jgi:hypothetical protein
VCVVVCGVGDSSLPFDAGIRNIPNVVDKKNSATQESCASDFDYIDGMEQQEAIIIERIAVRNN